jgi:hypothetical protein
MFSLLIFSSLAAADRVVEGLIDPKIIIIIKNTKQADRKRVYSEEEINPRGGLETKDGG